MKARFITLVTMILLAFCGISAHADAIQGEVLVHLQSGVSVAAFNQAYGTSVLVASPFTNSYRLAVPSGTDVSALLTRMASDRNVISAGPNLISRPLADDPVSQFIFTADADEVPASQFIFTADANVDPTSQFIFTADQFIFTADRNPGLFAYIAQPTSTLMNYGSVSKHHSGSGVIVAVLDTGVSRRNSLLAAHVLNGWNTLDGNSNTDDSPSGIDTNGNGIFDEDAGHGTMVAGLINRYAQGASILPVKVLNSDGAGSLWATTEGIRYAVARGAKVINMSFGSTQDSPILQEAIKDAWQAGVIIITAAGNNNTDIRQYPAGDNMTLAVGSVDTQNVKASFSNYGKWVDIVAPGVNVTSTFWNGHYASWSGTSFSSSIVAAEAALLVSICPDWSPSKLRKQILKNADSVNAQNPFYKGLLGKGIVDFDDTLNIN